MRTIRELRSRFLVDLREAVRRPEMFGGNAWGVELFISDRLINLCYIDRREADWEDAREDLKRRGLFGCSGVHGNFRWRISDAGHFACEVASAYAVVAHRLGYLPVERTLSAAEFRRLRTGLRAACGERDWRISEILDRFGSPSLRIGNASVLSYVARDTWIHFDFEPRSVRGPGQDYLLREVRLPARRFERELAFTPYGKKRLGR